VTHAQYGLKGSKWVENPPDSRRIHAVTSARHIRESDAEDRATKDVLLLDPSVIALIIILLIKIYNLTPGKVACIKSFQKLRKQWKLGGGGGS
jgi:hypothetical protein